MGGSAAWGVMLAPFLMCLVLTGIHGYLGIHVLSRKVIFVDLALAQIAALGTTCAYVLGYDLSRSSADASAVYWFSLCFTVLGAAVFALTRMRHERVPQEAFIGIVYASASAIAMLILAKAPGEGEHIKAMLVGNILLVDGWTILKTALIYSGIGAFHYFFRRQFFLISLHAETAESQGLRVRWWDFLFYASFGVVVTSSVGIAGVLLVFTYLVVPATCAVLLVEGLRPRIFLAWAAGAAASFAGIALSYQADLPTGPAVVAAFAAMLIAVAVWRAFQKSPAPLWTLARVGAGALAAVAIAAAMFGLRKQADESHLHAGEFEAYLAALDDDDESRRIDAIHHLEASRDPHAVAKLLEAARATSSDSTVLEHLIEAVAKIGDSRAAPALLEIARRQDLDPLLKVKAASAALTLKEPAGLEVLVEVAAAADSPPLASQEARQELGIFTGRAFESADAWRKWWKEEKDRIRWRENLKKFQ